MANDVGTKKLFARALVELSHAKNIDKITVRDIVGKSKLTKTTFYNHFRDKYDLMVWAYAEPLKKIILMSHKTERSLGGSIAAVLHYCAENRRFIINAIKNTSGQNYFLHHVAQIHFNIVKDFIVARSVTRKLLPRVEIMLKLYVFGTVQLLCEWLLKKMPIPVDEFADYLEAGVPEELKPYFYKM